MIKNRTATITVGIGIHPGERAKDHVRKKRDKRTELLLAAGVVLCAGLRNNFGNPAEASAEGIVRAAAVAVFGRGEPLMILLLLFLQKQSLVLH
jgi:hypothetical protein